MPRGVRGGKTANKGRVAGTVHRLVYWQTNNTKTIITANMGGGPCKAKLALPVERRRLSQNQECWERVERLTASGFTERV